MKMPENNSELLDVLYADTTVRDRRWAEIIEMMKDPQFSVTALREYKSDLWEYLVDQTNKVYDSIRR
jgi:hypothetical protein